MEYTIDYTIEGHMLKLKDGSIWEVKGLIHPKNSAIVKPKAIPHSEGLCINSSGERYRFLRSPSDRFEVISGRYRSFITYIPFLDAIDLLVEGKDVERIYDPTRSLLFMMYGEEYSETQYTLKDLLELISKESGVPYESLGVSGNIAAGIECPDEQLEVIVYGENEGLNVYMSVRRLMMKNKVLERLSQEDMERLYVEYGFEGRMDYNLYLKLMNRRFLVGSFKGYKYNIRLIPRRSRINPKTISVKRIGRATVIARIIDASQSIFTPSKYQVEIESVAEGPVVTKLVSEIYTLDPRFRELLWDGVEALVEGMVEKVVCKGKVEEEYYRMNLYSQTHTMIPLRRPSGSFEP